MEANIKEAIFLIIKNTRGGARYLTLEDNAPVFGSELDVYIMRLIREGRVGVKWDEIFKVKFYARRIKK